MQDPNPTAISVLIRTFNSARTLGKLFSSLPLSGNDEILVVDSGSTDPTLKIAEKYRAKIIHAPPPFNYSKSLNLGFKEAQHPWVLVLSSHSLPQVDDLLGKFREAIGRFSDEVVAGYGPSLVDQERQFPTGDLSFFSAGNFSTANQFCTNRNTIYRRSAWELLAFDENVRTAEDKVWASHIVAKGFTLALVPAASTINVNKYSLRYMFWKGYSETMAIPHEPMSFYNLLRSLRALLKRPLFYGMPLGNWIRCNAVTLGHFFASRAEQDNRPW